MLVWYRPEGSNTVPTPAAEPVCSHNDTTITLPQLTVEVQQYITDYLAKENLDKPAISIQPATTALVNLPTILSVTPASGQIELDVTQPIPGTVDLVPTYSWNFGDQSTSTPTVPGIPYDGTDPQTDPDHYPVLHTYPQAQTYTVTATITWTATTLHLNGLGDFPINKANTFPTTANLTTHEARAVLVTGQ